jgi:hypothetical protein
MLAGTLGCSSQKTPTTQGNEVIDAGCASSEYSAGVERIGVKRSTDRGLTWTFLGHACFHAPALIPVDPSPLRIDDGVALYFYDLLGARPGIEKRQIYRATSTNGVAFTVPQVAFTTADAITDPFVLRLTDGTYRMYLHTDKGILSAFSSDGLTFTPDDGTRTRAGGVPGALLLPSHEIRLFVCGQGILSLFSRDGLDFVQEEGMRIPWEGRLVADPHPIHLSTGGYLMAYKTVPEGGKTPQDDIVLLATSADGLNWVPGSKAIARGSVPGIVELADGTLLLYYVDFNY